MSMRKSFDLPVDQHTNSGACLSSRLHLSVDELESASPCALSSSFYLLHLSENGVRTAYKEYQAHRVAG